MAMPKKNPVNRFINSISSYDSNLMLAAVISLLVVVLFVLLLHIYAKWFLEQARHRRRSSSVSVSHVLRPSRFHSFNFDTTTFFSAASPSKGLDKSTISSIPLFVYKAEEGKRSLECVICLSAFEENEVGRCLTKCGHGFHVECIDMWLHSHSNCPICRAPAAAAVGDSSNEEKSVEVTGESPLVDVESGLIGIVDVPSSDNENNRSPVAECEPVSEESSSSSSTSSSLACSLKRMLSRNRSEKKVFPSSNITDQLNV